ncbi:MAG: Ku protein [Parachlamydiaceae bacterium]|nr:Ku protein [Parachlamydiaceae bacterium]
MRTIWTGAISFGLVNIPIRMYTATKDKELSFVLLHKKDLSQIRFARICKAEEKEVPWSEIVKGYEYDKGNYVVMNDEDFASANLKKSKTIEIINFINEDEIETLYYVKPYFLEPDKNAVMAYSLLREALKKSKKVGLAKFVFKNKEHLAVIKAHGNMIILNQLRYETELVKASDLDIPKALGKTESKELEIALKLIDHMTAPFTPEKYKDTYTEDLKNIIKQKSKGKTVHPKTDEPKPTKVHDIMSLLKASLEEKPTPKKKKSESPKPKVVKKARVAK